MNIETLSHYLNGKNIFVSEFIDNNKASEKYVRTTFVQDDGFKWDTVVPYADRRAGLKIKTEKELAEYLVSIKPYFRKKQWRIGKRKNLNVG